MGFSAKQLSKKDFRSISMPCRSHPSIYRIEKVLNMFKTWESTSSLSNPSAEIICNGLCQLKELYVCLDELVKTCLCQTSSISNDQNMRWTDELLDLSVSFLDIFGNTSDLMLQTKQHVRDLGCDLRRKGGPCIDNIIQSYLKFRKKLRKDIRRCVAVLNRLNKLINHCPFVADSNQNNQLVSVIQFFKEVKASTVVILRLLLKFFATPVMKKRSTSGWTTLSKYMSSGKVVPEENGNMNSNELQCLDNLFFRYGTSYKVESIQHTQKKLVELEMTIDDFNFHLESMSRHLISTRTSILNFVSFY